MLPTIVSLLFVIWSPAMKAAQVITNTSTVQQPGSKEFWISANLLNIEWKPNCLIITYCNRPELKMIKTNHINGEKSSFSWQLDENLKQLSNSAFTSHWTEGSPMDIEMGIEIIGVDPKYRFQRSCDQTLATKAFEYEVQDHSGNLNSGNNSNLGQMIVELQGRCFDVTLTIQKHIGRCPWCIRIETTMANSAIEPSENGFSLTKQYRLIVCVCIVTFCLITMCILQWIFNRYEKLKKSITRKATMSPVVQSTSWKIMKIDKNNHLTTDAMSRSKNSNNRIILKMNR